MLDLISVAALTTAITTAAQGVGGEAGRQTWNALTTLVHKTFGRRSPSGAGRAALRSRPSDEGRAGQLAAVLVARAHEHQLFADELADFLTLTQRDSGLATGQVINTVSGATYMQGTIIQGRDFAGPITFDGSSQENQN